MSDEEIGRTGRRNFMMATGALGVGAGMAMATGTAAAEGTGPVTNSFDKALTPFIANPGVVVSWNYFFGGADRGVQFAGPNILPPQNGAVHTILDQGKSISSAGFVTYFVRIRNDGAQ